MDTAKADMNNKSIKKVAILGGGVGSLVTAFELTEQQVNHPETQFDITVYQLGWRLGGKGASGRGECKRIEEHGIHIWGGCYENSFHVMRRCYDEYQRLGLYHQSPIRSIEEAFTPQEVYVVEECIDGVWTPWRMEIKATPGVFPGKGSFLLSTVDLILKLLRWIYDKIFNLGGTRDEPDRSEDQNVPFWKRIPWLQDEAAIAEHLAQRVELTIEDTTRGAVSKLLDLAEGLFDLLLKDESRRTKIYATIDNLINDFQEWVGKQLNRATQNDDMRHLRLMIELAFTVVRGLIADDVIFKGFLPLNSEEFVHWLQRHGASPDVYNSALINSMYMMSFLYKDGVVDNNNRSVAAGNWLYWMLRMAFTSEGASFFRLNAGMGDVIFAPLYAVLKARGVKFEFFHNVTNLGLNADKTAIETIEIAVQATLRPEYPEYDPLIMVKDLPCWPSEPRYEQLKEGEALKTGNINLESFWADWEAPDHKTLRRGEQFDVVVLGTSLDPLRYIATELIAHSKHWQDMINNVPSVFTREFQFWFNRSIEDMGRPGKPNAVIAFSEPGDSGFDMRQTLGREEWPAEYDPQGIWYTGSVMPTPTEVPPPSDHGYPQRAKDEVAKLIESYLENYGYVLWPDAIDPSNPIGLDWNVLIDLKNRTGKERLQAQSIRANVSPAERYVQLAANTIQYRLAPNDSKFENLYLTGDWVYIGVFTFGNVEGAVIGGMYASRAICGYPEKVIGE